MSFNYDFMSNGRRKHCPQPPISSVPPVKSPKSQDAHLFPMSLHVACNSTSLMPDCDEPYSGCPFNASLVELPINLDDMFHDWDMDNGSQSSATILSRSVSPTLSTNQPLSDTNHTFSEFVSTDLPARLTESRHCFIYPLHEPGERIAERTQQLRARTAAILRSLPATVENITDAFDNYVPQKHQHLGIYDDGHPLTVALSPKLRRVSGIPNMRNTFRGGDPVPIHPASISRTELFKVRNLNRRLVHTQT
ncbi:hypothetical protein BS17DRAFT_199062 [Gyrodon lividus]|nr:hypothetical protein BS17DRAFT_199062 [Gyrodon lividus]